MLILAIETSCDETALALVEASGGTRAPSFRTLAATVASQIEIHRPWGGVVPSLAKREHEKNLPVALSEIEEALKGRKLDVLAVTVGPGLEPALWMGVEFAKRLHKERFPKAKFIGANHLEGHLYSFLLAEKMESGKFQMTSSKLKSLFPAAALVVSGGHTILAIMKSISSWKKIGETRDDAAGEAFDKVAKMLGLPYPGGPEIQKAAAEGNVSAIEFPRPMLHDKNYDFSFSGLKTSVLYHIQKHPPRKNNVRDIAASFQEAAIDVLAKKTFRAAEAYGVKSILLSGGVAANAALRDRFATGARERNLAFVVPPISFNTDNAVMIAVAAYFEILRKKNYPMRANGLMNL